MRKREKNTALVPVQRPDSPKTDEQTKNTAPVSADSAPKMTIYEYEQRCVKRQNVRGAKFFLRFSAVLIGVFLFVLFALTAMRVYDFNKYAGYAAGAVLLLVYIFAFVVPLVKIMRTGYFVTNVNASTARKAQKHNKKLRHDIADKIIEFTAQVENVGWYDSAVVGELAIAMKTGDEEKIKQHLSTLFNGSVKKSAKSLVFRSSMKSATYSAVSQSEKLDAALVAMVNLELIKDIVFLYGFRPSDAKLLKIFGAVIRNSLVAYGVGGISKPIAKTIGATVRSIPLLGAAIETIIDSSVQGLANGTLTAVIGYQTIKYLNDEYKLQDVLDGIEIPETDMNVKEICAELETELKGKKKKSEVA